MANPVTPDGSDYPMLTTLTFEVAIEQFRDEDEASPTENDIQSALHRSLDGEFDLGAITVRQR